MRREDLKRGALVKWCGPVDVDDLEDSNSIGFDDHGEMENIFDGEWYVGDISSNPDSCAVRIYEFKKKGNPRERIGAWNWDWYWIENYMEYIHPVIVCCFCKEKVKHKDLELGLCPKCGRIATDQES